MRLLKSPISIIIIIIIIIIVVVVVITEKCLGCPLLAEHKRLNNVHCGPLLRELRCVFRNMFTFQQDNAPTIELLRRSTPDFIAPDMWPPNSSDLNLVDYAIWSIIQQRVYQTRVHDIDELRHRVITVWCGLEQRAVDYTIDQWQRPLRA